MPVLTVGRAPDNSLSLAEDPMVSRHHAELRLTPEGTILTDLGSANGTTIEGVRIPAHQPYLLASGTIFYIGSYGFVYELVAPPQREPARSDESAGIGGEAPPVEPEAAVPTPAQVAEPVPAPAPPPPPPPPAASAAPARATRA